MNISCRESSGSRTVIGTFLCIFVPRGIKKREDPDSGKSADYSLSNGVETRSVDPSGLFLLFMIHKLDMI
jgi:hypothetical protein